MLLVPDSSLMKSSLMKTLFHMLAMSWQASSSRAMVSQRNEEQSSNTNGYDVSSILDSYKERASEFQGILRSEEIFKNGGLNMFRMSYGGGARSFSLWSSGADERSTNLEFHAGLELSYNFFAGSAQTTFEKKTKSYSYYYEMDEFCRSAKADVTLINPVPYLKDAFKGYCSSRSPKDIREKYGDFYASKIELGGYVRRTVHIQTNSDDQNSRMKTTVETSMKKVVWEVNANVGSDQAWSSLSTNSRTDAVLTVRGGTSNNMWFSYSYKNPNSYKTAIDEWKQGLDNSPNSSYKPVRFFLRPLWTLVKDFNRNKGNALEKYYKNTVWKNDLARIDEWKKDLEKQKNKPRFPSLGAPAIQQNKERGLCMGIKDGIDQPKDDWNVHFRSECKEEWEAIPVRASQGPGGWYLIRHKSGKCLHPWGGNENVWDRTDLTVHKDCNSNRKAIWFKPHCASKAPGRVRINHYSGLCIQAQHSIPTHASQIDLRKSGCTGEGASVLWAGLDFGRDPAC